jgi:phosphonate transport system permease protein
MGSAVLDRRRFDDDHLDVVQLEAHRPRPASLRHDRKQRNRLLSTLPVLLLLAWTSWELGIGRRALVNGNGLGELGRFFRAAVKPRVYEQGADGPGALVLSRVIDATLVTIGYAVLGTVLSVLSGLLLGMLSTRARQDQLRWKPIALIIRVLTIPVRGTHEILWSLLLVNILGINPLVALIAIALPFGAVSTRVFAELFEAQPRGPFEALRAAGATRWQAFHYGIAPEALRDVSSYAFYRFECAIRAAAVLGVVGAGGLGFELALSFAEADYRGMWTFLWPLIALSAAADALSGWLRKGSHQGSKLGRALRRPLPLLFMMGAAGTASWFKLGIAPSTLWADRARKEFAFVRQSWFPPNFGSDHVSQLWPAARQTVAISIGSMVVSLLVAVPLAILTARAPEQRRWRQLSGLFGRWILLGSRAIPPSVWAFLVVLVLFPGPLPAAVALGIYNAGVLGRLMAEAVENVDPRPRLALRAAGARSTTVAAYATLPQAAPSFATYSLYRWEVSMRETIVVGVAAAGGLGQHIKILLASFSWDKVIAAVLVLLFITMAVDLISATIRRRLLA